MTSGKELLWTLSGVNEDAWQHGIASFQTDKWHTIVIEGVRGTGNTGDIAIDDVTIRRDASCKIQPDNAIPQYYAPNLVNCGFEGNFCNWINATDNTQFKLKWSLNVDPSSTDYKIKDHGALGSTGFIYLNDNTFKAGSKARIYSKTIAKPLPKGYCLSFYYHMYGDDVGTLNAYAVTALREISIFSKTGSQTNKWQLASIRLDQETLPADFQLAFDGISGNDFEGALALDEIKIGFDCPPSRICDFEVDTCGWTNDTSAEFSWTRSNEATISSGTGPSVDHTTGSQNGYYIYIDSSLPRIQNDKARIISPVYTGTRNSGDCFKFWYHMYGESTGTLNVLIKENGILTKNIWERSGNLGNQWRYAHVTIDNPNDFQVVFEGVIGTNHTGDIAVDDIEIENGECYPELACNFENDYCGYYNVKDLDDFDWERAQGQRYIITGPSVDHTTNTDEGYYVVIDPKSSHKEGDRAWLVSEVISAPESGCLNWYMHLKGRSIGSFSIYQRVGVEPLVTLFSVQKEQGKNWIFGEVTVPKTNKYFDIIFEATVGDGYFGNIALDDVEFYKGRTCETPTTVAPYLTTQMPSEFDELSCTFDTGDFCGWTPDSSTDSVWTKQNSVSSIYGQAPLNDVTLESSKGYYAFLNINSKQQKLQTATLKSSTFKGFAQDTCFEFWYQLNSPFKTGLSVSYGDSELWTRKGNDAEVWSHAFIRIPKTNQSDTELKSIQFNGNISSEFKGYLAIDDIKLIEGNCPTQKFCDFETDLCKFENDVSADMNWRRAQFSFFMGPYFYDHTYQTREGYYMSIQPSYFPGINIFSNLIY